MFLISISNNGCLHLQIAQHSTPSYTPCIVSEAESEISNANQEDAENKYQ